VHEEPLDARRPGGDLDLLAERDGRERVDALPRQDPREPARAQRVHPAAERGGVPPRDLLQVPRERGQGERAERVDRVTVDREAPGERDHGRASSHAGG
jgi:hypothetical protein